jgi:hypothetical protein
VFLFAENGFLSRAASLQMLCCLSCNEMIHPPRSQAHLSSISGNAAAIL